ncbi:FBXL6-like protein [Mya arenaria]|uniref:FBXL6-like protein n=1 Tax=Mya arenaria TaxID=6604 RepID=A0ABY7G286_MYAAR|nr:FBXL6-like protein [Mya arenaria]
MSKRRRVSRGILGVPRQGQILFSFQTREGEEWPSEDDDSDFSPGYSDSDEERTKTPTVKKQRKQESSKTCKPDDSKSIIATRTTKGLKGVSDVSVPGLPPELWLKIFILVVQEEGALPTLPRLRKALCQHVGVLRSLNLSNCSKLPAGSMETIVRACQHLRELDLSNTTWRHSLTHLDLSGIVGQGRLIKLVDDSLRVLHARNTHTTLQHINLSGSNCSTTAIRELLTNCISIEDLNLTSCRELARGIKREYKNRREMSNLKKDLQKKS